MKLRVTFKTPDAIETALWGKDVEDRAAMDATVNRFVQDGEYVTIEFDTDTQTAKVVPL